MSARNSTGEFLVGLELDEERIRGYVFRPTLEERAHYRLSTKLNRGADAVLDRLERCAREVVDEADLQLEHISGLGLGVPGVVDRASGLMIESAVAGWAGLNLASALAARLGFPVRVENAGNLAAMAAQALDLNGAPGKLLAVFLGNGVTGALLEDGVPLADARHPYRQISHLVVAPDGPPCGCGQRGCLEVMAGGASVIRSMRQTIAQTNGLESGKMEILTLGDWRKAAKKGDPLALEMTWKAARHLGEAMAKWIPRWNPDHIVVGGAIWDVAAKVMLPEMLGTIEKHLGAEALKNKEITVSRLGKAACATGAAYLAMQSTNTRVAPQQAVPTPVPTESAPPAEATV